jgi:hypothetical protein
MTNDLAAPGGTDMILILPGGAASKLQNYTVS